jgi:phosphoenolpyruvate-protein kinase (PTS system EI component)
VRALDFTACRKLAERALELDTAADVRSLVQEACPAAQ